MSRFYASIQGNRGEATRQGTKSSGITGHIRGWNIGVKAVCYVNEEGKDTIKVFLTGGSVNSFIKKALGTFTED